MVYSRPSSDSAGQSQVGRSRFSFDPRQRYVLESHFHSKSVHPSHFELEQLAAEVGASVKQIRVWFQNRRSKAKKDCLSKTSPGKSRNDMDNRIHVNPSCEPTKPTPEVGTEVQESYPTTRPFESSLHPHATGSYAPSYPHSSIQHLPTPMQTPLSSFDHSSSLPDHHLSIPSSDPTPADRMKSTTCQVYGSDRKHTECLNSTFKEPSLPSHANEQKTGNSLSATFPPQNYNAPASMSVDMRDLHSLPSSNFPILPAEQAPSTVSSTSPFSSSFSLSTFQPSPLSSDTSTLTSPPPQTLDFEFDISNLNLLSQLDSLFPFPLPSPPPTTASSSLHSPITTFPDPIVNTSTGEVFFETVPFNSSVYNDLPTCLGNYPTSISIPISLPLPLRSSYTPQIDKPVPMPVSVPVPHHGSDSLPAQSNHLMSTGNGHDPNFKTNQYVHLGNGHDPNFKTNKYVHLGNGHDPNCRVNDPTNQANKNVHLGLTNISTVMTNNHHQERQQPQQQQPQCQPQPQPHSQSLPRNDNHTFSIPLRDWQLIDHTFP
ncbi:hypothetical protein BKA69DRAFT_1178345 [Paraphysoderma sedebokerense]|nr:hypothetical protein BKA69DRAFT_1178345 [Paraphysoderma sedebokerense]